MRAAALFCLLFCLAPAASADPMDQGGAWLCSGSVPGAPGVRLRVASQPAADFPVMSTIQYHRTTEPFDGSWFAQSDSIFALGPFVPSTKWNGGAFELVYAADVVVVRRRSGQKLGEVAARLTFTVNLKTNEGVVRLVDKVSKEPREEKASCAVYGAR